MSLNWNATKCRNWDKLDSNHKESLIFACMPVGIGEITEANHEEWYNRYLQMYLACGWGEPYLSLEDVKHGIGLTTNVFPKVTTAAFRKKMAMKIEERAAAQLIAAKKEAEADA